MAKIRTSSFLLVGLILSAVDSASIARVSERDLLTSLNRVARTERFSFFKDFGNTKVSGFYNKENKTAGFNATHNFDNGNFTAHFHWDNNDWWSSVFEGAFNSDDDNAEGEDDNKDDGGEGGFHGNYSWNNGKTLFSGHVSFGDDGNPKGHFSFNHKS